MQAGAEGIAINARIVKVVGRRRYLETGFGGIISIEPILSGAHKLLSAYKATDCKCGYKN
jgi:hypothetical protein